MSLKKYLDKELAYRDTQNELSLDKPDPLLIAKRYNDEYIALASALFAYGSAKAIVKFLDSIDFDIFSEDTKEIQRYFQNHYYRFQNSQDITTFFLTLKKLRNEMSLHEVFLSGYNQEHNVLTGIGAIISKIHENGEFSSHGANFLIGQPPNILKPKGQSPYKRWNMFLRWMVRYDNLDLGLWSGVDRADLILPLDTHTFKVSQKLGLLKRKTYDLESALLITDRLKEFDKDDPIKYDFALYRIGQEKLNLDKF